MTQTTGTAGTPPVSASTQSGVTAVATTTQPAVTVTAATQLTTTTTKFFTLNVDIVFLLDISSAVNQADYNDMVSMVQRTGEWRIQGWGHVSQNREFLKKNGIFGRNSIENEIFT